MGRGTVRGMVEGPLRQPFGLPPPHELRSQGGELRRAAVAAADGQPGAGLTLRLGDLAGGHLEGDLGAAFLAAGAPGESREIEPFVRFDEVDCDSASPRRISDSKLEQGVDIASFGIGKAAPKKEFRALLA